MKLMSTQKKAAKVGAWQALRKPLSIIAVR